MQIVRKNFALKLLAVSLAIVGWAYFRFASNPIVATAQFNQQVSIPITAVDLPFGFVAHYADRQAVVTVASKRGEPAIKPEEIKAVLDLTNKETGVYNVPVQLVAPDVVVQSLSPASVTLTVEKLEEHAFPVTVHYVGTLPKWHRGKRRADRTASRRRTRTDVAAGASGGGACGRDAAERAEVARRNGAARCGQRGGRRGCGTGRCSEPRAAAGAFRHRVQQVSRLFGTDGVRGVANRDLTPELAYRLGRATASLLTETVERAPVIIGRDTRLSGSMLEAAIVAGITSVGRDTISLGIVPTPAVACVTKRTAAAAGVVISASHNPIEDNGIKLFGSDGFKFADAFEDEIEELIDATDLPRPIGAGVGKARVAQNLARHYYEELYAEGVDLTGLTAIVDAACGAAYAIAPYALRKLGATVIEINCEDEGARINVGGGATDLRPLQAAVRAKIAEGERRVVGVAFDGDADRALFVDETGMVVSGDHVMFAWPAICTNEASCPATRSSRR